MSDNEFYAIMAAGLLIFIIVCIVLYRRAARDHRPPYDGSGGIGGGDPNDLPRNPRR